MKSVLTLGVVALLGAASAHAQTAQNTAAECDVAPVGEYLSQTVKEFDQGPDGWRSIGNAKEGCELAAADLIAEYRSHLLDQAAGLEWHEAQGRAFGGQHAQALELFKRGLAHQLAATGDRRVEDSILKAEATVAFMEGDLPRLQAARDRLAALPMPEGFAEGVAKFRERYPDRTPPTWPVNLDMVDGFIRCFGRLYAEAMLCRSATQ